MLGRHVYRVSPSPQGGWQVAKDGEAGPRAQPPTREAALTLARDLAAADAPSKILVLEADGTLADERLFGADPGETIET
jgi:Uncharacterized protein conserved in bacteria (DUF2188)